MRNSNFKSQEEASKLLDRVRKYIDVAINLANKTDKCANNHLENIILTIDTELDSENEKTYKVFAIGNWNNTDRYNEETNTREDTSNIVKRLSDILERVGVELRWEDEVSFCGDCGKMIETQPDSYFWKPNYIELDGDYICLECVDEDVYIERWLLDSDSIHYQSIRKINFESWEFECKREFESYYSSESIKYELDKDGVNNFVLVKEKFGEPCKVYVKIEEEEEDSE